jgi:hypothetical protein
MYIEYKESYLKASRALEIVSKQLIERLIRRAKLIIP